jgi:hypothetical protein
MSVTENSPRMILGVHQEYTILHCVRDDISAVHALSCHIFDNQQTPSAHPSLAEWYSRFDERKGMILAVCTTNDDNDSSPRAQLTPEKLCSYIFAYESKSVLSEKLCMHVWLCATEDPHRSKGITR